MSWYDNLEHKLQYEETRTRNLKHFKPTPHPRRSWAPLRTRLAHILQTAARSFGDQTLQQHRPENGVTARTKAEPGAPHNDNCGAPHRDVHCDQSRDRTLWISQKKGYQQSPKPLVQQYAFAVLPRKNPSLLGFQAGFGAVLGDLCALWLKCEIELRHNHKGNRRDSVSGQRDAA